MHSLRNDQSSCNRALVGRCAVSVLLSGALLMISGVSTTRVGAQGQAAPEKFRRVANPARFITHASPTSQENLTSNTALTTLNWHHLAAVFDGSEKRLYIDGVLDKWFPSTFAPGTGGGRLTIGAAPDATQFFNGL